MSDEPRPDGEEQDPGPPPAEFAEIAEWLRGAAVVPTEELIHDDH